MTRTGIEDLLDTVQIVADVQELKANPKRSAVGTVVEAELDKGRGPVATVLVQTGTLNVGDVVVVGDTYGRVRALQNSRGERISKAGPSTPAVILGLGEVPAAGDILRVVPDEKTARTLIEQRRAGTAPETTGRATLEDLYRQIQAGQTKELGIILKADVQGSLGAIRHALEQVQTDEVRINILHEAHRRHQRQRHPARVGVERDRRRLQYQARSAGAPHGRGRRCRRPPVRHHLQADRRDERRAARPARARRDRGRRGPRGGAPDVPQSDAT